MHFTGPIGGLSSDPCCQFGPVVIDGGPQLFAGDGGTGCQSFIRQILRWHLVVDHSDFPTSFAGSVGQGIAKNSELNRLSAPFGDNPTKPAGGGDGNKLPGPTVMPI